MAQFRTTADILNEILQKAGEPISGTSQYETIARTYANNVHHAIIGGGNIFDLEVDEAWTWARSRFPIVLELQPAYVTGAISGTAASTDISFSSAPTTSLEGWHVQLAGKPTVYKITQHTAATTGAVLDSDFLESAGSYNFRAFKLDYEIFPTHMYVDNFSDKLEFQETAATTLTAALTHGAYTPSALITHVAAQLESAGTATYAGAYDSVLKQFNVSANVTWKMYGVSGSQTKRSALPLTGFDRLDYTGAQSYTSTYTPNQIARLIEPFKLFSQAGGDPFIYSSDPIKMQEDFPIAWTEQRIPDRFVRLTEESDGTVWVRFNAYPASKTKVTIDWIPQPIDLQDNAASVPALPRGDIYALIHAAAAMVAFDKNDSKWEGFLGLAKAGLEAMKKKNRAALFRTGESFAQQVPREDLRARRQRLNFGYLVSGSTASSTAESVGSMIHVSLGYNNFTAAGVTANSVTAHVQAATRTLLTVIAKHSTSFAGTAISSVRLDLGTVSDPTKFINAFDVSQATASTASVSSIVSFYPAVATDIVARITSVGANLSALSAGGIELYFNEVTT